MFGRAAIKQEGGARIRFEEVCCLVFKASMKREIRHFHIVVVQRRQSNVQKSARDARVKSLFC